MPSKTKGQPADQHPLLEELTALSNQVFEHVAEEQWEQLVTTLHLRQQCLDALFSGAVAESEILKALASSILEQDAILIARILEQKKIVEKQILELDKGRQAIQAYGA